MSIMNIINIVIRKIRTKIRDHCGLNSKKFIVKYYHNYD
jgi:hypothetical protein